MKPAHIRAIAYTGVALLAVAALRATPPIIAPPQAVAAITTGTDTDSASLEPRWEQQDDTLARGESLSAVLLRGGLANTDVFAVIRAATTLDDRRVPAGMPVTLRRLAGDTSPSEIVFKLGLDRLVYLSRTAEGWSEREERLPWTTDTVAVAGVVTSTLYEALDSAATPFPRPLRAELAWALADIFEYRVDMSRDLQPGQRFRVLVERSSTTTGHVRMGKVLAASFDFADGPAQAFRMDRDKGRADYYDASGKSLRAAFLRAPLEFRRISSVFGRRYHPILKSWKSHKGTDYAAASGTPVRAIGNGVVAFAGKRSGYGNTIDIRHPNGYVTRYAHLRGFARGVRRGTSVEIGRTVGYVGMTGLATGPHLHFEVLVNGSQRDSRVALRDKSGEPVPARERAAFDALRDQRLALLDSVVPQAVLASRQ